MLRGVKRTSEAEFVKNYRGHLKFVETKVQPIAVTAPGKLTTYLIPRQDFDDCMRLRKIWGPAAKRLKR